MVALASADMGDKVWIKGPASNPISGGASAHPPWRTASSETEAVAHAAAYALLVPSRRQQFNGPETGEHSLECFAAKGDGDDEAPRSTNHHPQE